MKLSLRLEEVTNYSIKKMKTRTITHHDDEEIEELHEDINRAVKQNSTKHTILMADFNATVEKPMDGNNNERSRYYRRQSR